MAADIVGPSERTQWELEQIISHLIQVQPLTPLPLQLLEELAKNIFFEVLDPGITLCHAGDYGTNWYVVLSGSLELTYYSSGTQHLSNHHFGEQEDLDQTVEEEQKFQLSSGCTFGESVLTDVPRKATVVTKESCQLLRIEQDDFRIIWERNRELMDSLVGAVKFGNKNNEFEKERNDLEQQQPFVETEAQHKNRVSSSGEEESEDSERHPHRDSLSGKENSVSSNWSPRMAFRHLSSFRKKTRESRRKNSNDNRSYSFSSPTRESPSPSKGSRSKTISEGGTNNGLPSLPPSAASPPPIRIATRSVSPPVDSPEIEIQVSKIEMQPFQKATPKVTDVQPLQKVTQKVIDVQPFQKVTQKVVDVQPFQKVTPKVIDVQPFEKVSPKVIDVQPFQKVAPKVIDVQPFQKVAPKVTPKASPNAEEKKTPSESEVTSQESPSKEKTKTKNSEETNNKIVEESEPTINKETLKQNIKLQINSKRFSENPKKSLSRSGLSPGALKKAFQFTRSSSWTQKKLATSSPPCGQRILRSDHSTGTKESPAASSNATPTSTPTRRPSLVRAPSFDNPDPNPKQQHMKSEALRTSRCESFDTPDEEDEDDESLPRSTAGDEEEEYSGEPGGVSKKERGSVQHERSQELDSPSNAALPILETPSVRVCEAAWVLRTLILTRNPTLLQDRKSGSSQVPRCAIGAELTEWLVNQSAATHSRALAASMWQVLLEEGALLHVTCEQPFRDKYLFYRFLEDNNAEVGDPLPSPSSQEKRDAEERLPSIIAFLSQKAPDATLRLILRKPSYERTFEDQELIYEELLHLRALAHLSNSVKRELAAVIKFESHMREGTVLFEQGCEGKSWFIIIRGSVDVSIHGKGVVNTLQEGDDFGKLALVNDAPRAATIVLKEDNCQFLRVDKGDFNRILRDVEANTVRLKEHGKDVLVLEKVSSSHTHSQYKYTVMAGTPQKMLEHLLETRLDGRRIGGSDTLTMGVGVAVGMGVAMGASMGVGDAQDSHLTIKRCEFSTSDFFLDDFLLTHIVFMPYDQLTSELFEHYRVTGGSSNQDEAFMLACKRRVVHFTHRWVMTISDPIFSNKDAAKFLRDLKNEVDEDVKKYGSALRDEASLMLSSVESLERYEQEVSAAGVSKWKLPTSGKPISLFGSSSVEEDDDVPRKIHAHDDIIFRVYCADHTYCTLRFPLSAPGETIKRSAADKLGLNLENLLLVELKSNGETSQVKDREVCVPTGLTINGRLFVSHKDHLDALTALSEQEGPGEGSLTQLEMFSTKELAYHMTSYDWDLFLTIHEYEFIYQVFGRDYFGEVMCNLDVFRRRFNEIQFWVVTETCLANTLSKRTQLLRKFIKLAAYCKEQQNLNAFFAIVIGLSNVAVSRLTQTWERLSSRFRKMYIEFEILIDPSRNHRAYRLFVAKLHPPIIPFTPLLMKDMTFTHEGNRTHIENLINFEKMHMIAQTLRTIRYCRSKNINLDPPTVPKNENEIRLYVRNLHVIDNQRRLLTLSQRHEPKRP